MTAKPQHWTLIDPSHPATTAPQNARLSTAGGEFGIDFRRLEGGPSRGVDALTVDHAGGKTVILPTRGMGVWNSWAGDWPLGWKSPIRGPVHPSLVPIWEPSGLGWLEGFDELLVRCGLSSFGAPQHDAAGRLEFPLHGRIANLPAHHLRLELDADNDTVHIVGEVDEVRFLFHHLRLTSRYTLSSTCAGMELVDRITNLGGRPAQAQLLYHVNLGAPVLQAGSTVHLPLRRLAPRDATAAAAVDTWSEMSGPVAGFAEQVYFAQPLADSEGWTSALLSEPGGGRGIQLSFATDSLPYFTLWKNTAAEQDGYVVGFEPGTGFPNQRSREQQAGRVLTLEPGESVELRLKLLPLEGTAAVAAARRAIEQVQARERPQLLDQPASDW